ncbi:unnamed protein product [Lactuca saligna]|uniref:Uncharacterized protein n=1 Tax=Lactuca saligna TaxID=75948 RepID=A0AA36EH49_LACSI|nr:unnamed protein product [Lactuca saligna]
MDTLILMILMDVILLQVLGSVASIKAGETSHSGYDYWKWKAVFFLSDYGSCVIMFSMYSSIISLREAHETDGSAARDLEKLRLFVLAAFGYVFFTRVIVVFGLAPLVVDKWPWMIDAAKETGNLVFCMVMFYMYRPLEKHVVGVEELGL